MNSIMSLLLMLALNFSFAQNLSGKIIYKKTMSFNISKKENKEYISWAKAVKNSLDKMNYILKFNKSQSYFYFEKLMNSDIEKLDRRAVGSGKGKNKFYTDLNNNNNIEEVKIGSETFLVTNLKPKLNLTKETKIIHGYTCYKAISKEIVDFSKLNIGVKDVAVEIIAWYTPEINFQFGPISFFGLPGLILELQYGDVTYTAVQINLNNKKTDIEIPSVGKNLSKKEFDSLLRNRIKQLFEK